MSPQTSSLPPPPPCPAFRDMPSLCIQLVQCRLCDTHYAGHGKCKLAHDSLWVWELGRDRCCGGRIWQAWTGRRGGSAPYTWGVGAGVACPECSRWEDFQEEVGKSKQRRVWANTRDKKQPRAVGTWVPPHWALCQQLSSPQACADVFLAFVFASLSSVPDSILHCLLIILIVLLTFYCETLKIHTEVGTLTISHAPITVSTIINSVLHLDPPHFIILK